MQISKISRKFNKTTEWTSVKTEYRYFALINYFINYNNLKIFVSNEFSYVNIFVNKLKIKLK